MHPALAFVFIVPFLPTGPHVHADADLNDPHHAMSFGPKNTAEVAAMAAQIHGRTPLPGHGTAGRKKTLKPCPMRWAAGSSWKPCPSCWALDHPRLDY